MHFSVTSGVCPADTHAVDTIHCHPLTFVLENISIALLGLFSLHRLPTVLTLSSGPATSSALPWRRQPNKGIWPVTHTEPIAFSSVSRVGVSAISGGPAWDTKIPSPLLGVCCPTEPGH